MPRPLRSSYALHSQDLLGGDNILDLHQTWPPLLDVGDLSMANINYTALSPPDPTPDPTPQDPRSACIRQLSAIAVEIDDVSVELSPVTSIHLSKDGDLEEFYSQHVIQVSHARCIEQLFTLAQRLTDLYPTLLRLLSSRASSPRTDNCQDADCFHNCEVSEEFASMFTEAYPAHSPIDTFLLNLLAACHGKVSDVLDHIVTATKFCAKVTTASPNLIQPRLHIPELRVGSFVASAASASSMQATLFAHITSVLGENAKQLRKAVEDASRGAAPSDKGTRVTLLQCEMLEERSELQAAQFTKIRDGLTKCTYIQQPTEKSGSSKSATG
ncbi:putative transcription factor ACEII [Rosellinia necatrix]|uniref:Putative transcription factor ACEII n=1 Tax=Rosellinia necatrix TaxID=77044 RepID=A0A1S8A6G9_ROSNE|nr:putative transcription factor ACEII [Rosellinia necatrix]